MIFKLQIYEFCSSNQIFIQYLSTPIAEIDVLKEIIWIIFDEK